MENIRVMLVGDDDLFWKKHLAKQLREEADMNVIHIAATREEAVEAADCLAPDVILIDIHLSPNQYEGLEAAKQISLIGNSKLIILTSAPENNVIIQAFQLGAINCLTKSSIPEIVKAIRDAYHNSSPIHRDVAGIIRNELRLMLLTPSEREVYDLYRSGLNKTQISEKMHKSFNTIKTQLKSIKSKLLIR
ncbi:MAG: response regulator [Clostridia bacterium]